MQATAGRKPDPRDREVIRGGSFDLSALSLDALKAAAQVLVSETQAKEISAPPRSPVSGRRPACFGQRAGARYRRPGRRMVSLAHPCRGTFTSFAPEDMEAIARRVMRDVPVRDSVWMEDYDHYYHSRDRTRPLPVLRVRYLDDRATWLYFVPQTGDVVMQNRTSRARRWLYSALHHGSAMGTARSSPSANIASRYSAISTWVFLVEA
jgi:hypothetical protein